MLQIYRKYAQRVPPAVTRLTVYRRLRVLTKNDEKNEVSRKCLGSSQSVSRMSGRLQNTTEINFKMSQKQMIKLGKLKISIQTEGLGYYI